MMTMLARRPSSPPTRGRHLPAPPLRGRVLLAAALGCVIVGGSALLVQWWLGTTPTQPLVAVAVFALLMIIAIGTMHDHHPFPRFGLANHMTMVRLMLVAVVASMINEPTGPAGAWALVSATAIVAALDGMDGWFARRTQMSSTFGARFDMETDAFFMLVLSLLVWRHHKAGGWVIGIGLMRYAFVTAGLVLPWLSRPLRSTQRGKAVAIGQLAGLGIGLVPLVPVTLSSLAAATALTALVWSFAIDVRSLWLNRKRGE